MQIKNNELNWLKDKRQSMNLSTYAVAHAIGISQSLYSSIENGLRRATVDNAKKIARYYGFEWTKFFN